LGDHRSFGRHARAVENVHSAVRAIIEQRWPRASAVRFLTSRTETAPRYQVRVSGVGTLVSATGRREEFDYSGLSGLSGTLVQGATISLR
jgi:hypothetical protein